MASKRWLPNRKRWQIRWYAVIDGQEKTGSRTFQSEADRYAALCEEEIASARQPTPTYDALASAVARWQTTIERTCTDRTAGLYKDVLARFLAALPEDTDVSSLNARHIADYLDAMSGVTNRTVNSHLTALKSFGKWLAERYSLPNPAATVKMRREDPPDARFLKAAEYRKVLALATGQMRDVLQVIANTGLRVSELLALTGADVQGSVVVVTG